jgi:hypothetical protein
MEIHQTTNFYLTGQKLSGSYSLPITRPEMKITRKIDFLVDSVRGKRIVHIGCADHKQMIDDKIQKGIWLHGLLDKSAALCVGVDIDQDAIDYMRHLGYAACYVDPPAEVIEAKWDALILGDVLEHVDDPVAFLKGLRQYDADSMIITVPNALRWINFKRMIKGSEIINSDHRYWFTPYTLAKVCVMAGLRPVEFRFLLDYNLSKISPISNTLYRMCPALLDSLCIVTKNTER